MTEVQRNLVTAGLVCGAAAAVVSGIAMRENVDLGRTSLLAAEGPIRNALVAGTTVDTEIPEAQYFEQMQILLKREYVEPIRDEMKLAGGAVRGMINSLDDERCMYLDQNAMRTYLKALKGQYEGIGADIVFVRSAGPRSRSLEVGSDEPSAALGSSGVPKVVVAFVVPGGPADGAGIRPGDSVESIDGRWVINPEMIDRILLTQRKVRSKEWPSSKLHELRKELREKSENSMTPFRALERLNQGKGGTMKVEWRRGKDLVATTLIKANSAMKALARTAPDTYRIRLWPGTSKELRQVIQGKNAVTLDLRGASVGTLDELAPSLAVLGPSGTYGQIRTQKTGASATLKVKGSNSKPPKITVLVDSQTRGVSEAFAVALENKGLASIRGSSAGDPALIELQRLPGGNGYTLVSGVLVRSKTAKGAGRS